MDRVVVRSTELRLAAAESVTVPAPDPLLPDVTVSHGAWLVAVQPQPAVLVTETLDVPPPATKLCAVDDTPYVQEAAGCEMLTAFPATVRTAERVLVAVFGVTEKATEPLPVPLAPDVIVSQLVLDDAVQVHPPPAVTVSVALPPPTGRL
jgi:hypothetical protein